MAQCPDSETLPAWPGQPSGLDRQLARARTPEQDLRWWLDWEPEPGPDGLAPPPAPPEARAGSVEALAEALAREERLVARARPAEEALDRSPHPLFEVDARLRVRHANQAASALIGIPVDEARGLPLLDLLRPAGAPGLGADWVGRLERREPIAQTLQSTTAAGRSLLLDWVCMPELKAGGKLARVRVLVREVTAPAEPPLRPGAAPPAADAGPTPLCPAPPLDPQPSADELRSAGLRGEWRVAYQPIVQLASGQIQAFEALARWRHPRLGLLAPERFLELAASTGELPSLDRTVMKAAAQQLEQWRRRRREAAMISMSVNPSAELLAQPDLPQELRRLFEETGLEAGDLTLDLSEGLLGQGALAPASLASLHASGVGLHVDQFGAGRVWLRHLRRPELESVKLDRALLDAGWVDRAVLRALVKLARDLGKTVIATGVESAAQLQLAREAGCHSAQGYFLSPPVEAAEAEALLSGRNALAAG